MKWASTYSNDLQLETAIGDCAWVIGEAFGGKAPDLVLIFLTPHYAEGFDSVPELVARHLKAAHLVGCTGEGVIGGGRELEFQATVAMTAAVLPDVSLSTFHLTHTEPEDLAPATLAKKVPFPAENGPSFLLFSDPFTFPTEPFLSKMDLAFPFSQKVGGLASGANRPGFTALFQDGVMHRKGMVGVAFDGNLTIDSVVAQGCRPIGTPLFVTACRRTQIQALNDGLPREVLQALYDSLSPDDQALFQNELFLGIEMKPDETVVDSGDFLIRNILGMTEQGYLQVGAHLNENTAIQFHLRDKRASHEDLEHQLVRYGEISKSTGPQGALLFSCLGRGSRFYGESDHDIRLFQETIGSIPVGGFFCSGEIGPVQGITYLHGYTSSFALFRART